MVAVGDSQRWSFQVAIYVYISKGISYLHNLRHPVVHGDFKPSDILLTAKEKRIIIKFKGTLCKISIFYGEVYGTTASQKIVLCMRFGPF